LSWGALVGEKRGSKTKIGKENRFWEGKRAEKTQRPPEDKVEGEP